MTRRRLSAAQVAERLNIKKNTWFAYVARGQAPAPDGYEELSGHPFWYESTVTTWVRARPGSGYWR